jgi:hypothetical protein
VVDQHEKALITKTYSGVTAAKIEKLKSSALSAGIEVKPDPDAPTDANRCLIHRLTITARLVYDPAAQTLLLAISGFGADSALQKIERLGGLSS